MTIWTAARVLGLALAVGCGAQAPPPPRCPARPACLDGADALRDAWAEIAMNAENERDALAALHLTGADRRAWDEVRERHRAWTRALQHVERIRASLLACDPAGAGDLDALGRLLETEGGRRLPPRRGSLDALIARTRMHHEACRP